MSFCINSDLNDNPEFVNSDPYQKGWMVKVAITDLAEVNALLSADDYKALVGA